MKIYTVHYPPEAGVSMTGLARDAVVVKDGFAWLAFFVPLVWLVYQRMWIVLAVYVAAEIVIAILGGLFGAPEALTMTFSLMLSLILGFEGYDLYRWTLARRRYNQQAVVTAPSLLEAEHRFFTHAARAFHRPVNVGAAA